jgi:hypothetical protein
LCTSIKHNSSGGRRRYTEFAIMSLFKYTFFAPWGAMLIAFTPI